MKPFTKNVSRAYVAMSLVCELCVCVYVGTGEEPHFLLRVVTALCNKMYKIFETVAETEGISKT